MKEILIALSLLSTTPITLVDETESEVVTEPVEETTATETETNAWEDFVKEYLSAEKVAMYMSWVAYIGTIIGLVANINRLKKANNLTLKNVSDDVQKKLESVIGEEFTKEAEKFLPSILETQEKTNDILKIFSKILALSQQNTPESRVAILHLIEELGTIGKEITESAKEAIEEEVKQIEEHKEEIDNKLDEIIDEYDGTTI